MQNKNANPSMAVFFTAAILLGLLSLLQALPAFPGAQGYGSLTPGGRGGKVLVVTNTNATGAGSFQNALLTTGPRIIVFRVSGVIQLADQILMESANYSYLTIAGQTSPGGITISSTVNTPIWQYSSNKCHDEIWRFLRFRVQTDNNDHAFEHYFDSNFVLDHCDFSGGADECLDLCDNHDYTVQWCTIANSIPGAGSWGGFIAAYNPTHDISIHHNLFANHFGRCGINAHWGDQAPQNNGMVDFRNNVCYNVSGSDYFVHIAMAATPAHVNLVGNYFRAGPAGPVDGNFWNEVTLVGTLTYDFGNYFDPSPNDALSKVAGIKPVKADRIDAPVATEWAMASVTTQRSDSVYNLVLNRSGAWPRDPMNTRTVNDVRTRTGTLRNISDALITTGPAAPADADNDGMSDSWETAAGLSPADATDNIKDRNGDGYTNIEEYINCVADSLLGSPCPPPQSVESANRARVMGLSVSAGPNPYAGGALRIKCHGAAGGSLCIIDASGRTLSRMAAKTEVIWNGMTAEGKRVPAGVYFIRWESKQRTTVQERVVIL